LSYTARGIPVRYHCPVGNITSQRTHIRRKLGLLPDEDLKKALQARMESRKCADEAGETTAG
jgi:hypothetical protein